MDLDTDELRQVIELLVIAITADMPVSMRHRMAERLRELGQAHQAHSASVGTYCANLADLLRSLPGPTPPTH